MNDDEYFLPGSKNQDFCVQKVKLKELVRSKYARGRRIHNLENRTFISSQPGIYVRTYLRAYYVQAVFGSAIIPVESTSRRSEPTLTKYFHFSK